MKDFKTTVKLNFPKSGTNTTPKHHFKNFIFKDYFPFVFRHIRECFGIDAGTYMVSICGDSKLKKVPGAGKSGALFYYSHDDRFVIKTVTKKESDALFDMLPYYYNHVMANPNTLIVKFLSFHRLQIGGGRNVSYPIQSFTYFFTFLFY